MENKPEIQIDNMPWYTVSHYTGNYIENPDTDDEEEYSFSIVISENNEQGYDRVDINWSDDSPEDTENIEQTIKNKWNERG